jgi:hypothetical protein
MGIRVRPATVVLFALVAGLAVGCSQTSPATDPESLKKGAEEIKQMSQKENAGKKEKKGQAGE